MVYLLDVELITDYNLGMENLGLKLSPPLREIRDWDLRVLYKEGSLCLTVLFSEMLEFHIILFWVIMWKVQFV